MKVYVVEWWSWTYENGVSGVFSSREKAEDWVKTRDEWLVDGYNIEEYNLDEGNDVLD